MICDFKEDRPGLLPRMASIHSHLRLLEAASPRLKLRNEESPATGLSYHKFSITMMIWEVRQVKPGNERIRDTLVACGHTQCLSYKLLRWSRKAAFCPSTNVSLKPGKALPFLG